MKFFCRLFFRLNQDSREINAKNNRRRQTSKILNEEMKKISHIFDTLGGIPTSKYGRRWITTVANDVSISFCFLYHRIYIKMSKHHTKSLKRDYKLTFNFF